MSAQSFAHRNTGLRYSALLHALLILLAIVGLPKWFHRTPDFEPQVMTVDILPFSQMSNVRPQQEAPTPPKPEVKPEPAQSKKAMPETHKAETHKSEAVPMPSPTPQKPAAKTADQKKQDEDLQKIPQSVKDTAKTQEAQKPKTAPAAPAKAAKSEHYDPAMPLSISEKDAIRNQFIVCWNVPAGAKNAENLIVTLRVQLAEDASVTQVELARDEARYASDSFFRAAADSAMRAVHLCSPLKNLPPDKFAAWKDMELTFDPREMLF